MTYAKRNNRQSAIAQIHIAKKQLGLDDDTYRQALATATGKASCADMTLAELYQVVAHFENTGFKKRRPVKKQYSPKASGKIIDVMRAVWIEMYKAGAIRDGSELALSAWAKRASSKRNGGIGVDNLEWLEQNPKLASQVLEDLKQWNKRVQREWQNQDLRTISLAQQATDLPQVDVINHLLSERRIMWWPIFEGVGIEQQAHYCHCRRELTHE